MMPVTISRASDKSRFRADVNLANPITELTDVGESNVHFEIATIPLYRTYTDDTTKIPDPVLLET